MRFSWWWRGDVRRLDRGSTTGPRCGAGLIRVALGGWLAATVSGAALAEHVVAVVATDGSPHQPAGVEVIAGAEAGVARINAAGGVLDLPLRVEVRREDCTRERATEVAEEVARIKPAVVIGHTCAGAAIAAAEIYAKAGIVLIAPGVRHPAVTRGDGRLVLRLAGRADRFAANTARFIASRFAGKGAAVIADRTRQARGLADGLVAELKRRNMPPRLDERIESAEKDYGAVAARIRASGAGVVVMPAQPVELDVLSANLRRAGVEAPILGSEILAVPALMPIVRRMGEQLIVMLPWTGLEHDREFRSEGADDTDSQVQREAARRRAEAAVEVWAAAARRAGSVKAAAVMAAARAADTQTVVGSLRFDEAGDAIVPGYVPHVWRGDGWHSIGD